MATMAKAKRNTASRKQPKRKADQIWEAQRELNIRQSKLVAKQAEEALRIRQEGLAELASARALIAKGYETLNRAVRVVHSDEWDRLRESIDRVASIMVPPSQLLHKIAETERRLGRLEGLLKDLPTL